MKVLSLLPSIYLSERQLQIGEYKLLSEYFHQTMGPLRKLALLQFDFSDILNLHQHLLMSLMIVSLLMILQSSLLFIHFINVQIIS